MPRPKLDEKKMIHAILYRNGGFPVDEEAEDEAVEIAIALCKKSEEIIK